MNIIIIGQEWEGYYSKKNSYFDILSLANHLHRFQSTIPKGLSLEKIYFLLNLVPNLFAEDIEALFSNINLYNWSFEKNKVLTSIIFSYKSGSTLNNLLNLDARNIETINEMFNIAGEVIISKRAEIKIWLVFLLKQAIRKLRVKSC